MAESNPLTTLLLPALTGASRAALEGAAGVEETLEDLYGTGTRAWPTVTLTAREFVQLIARRVEPGSLSELRDLRAGDLYLLCAYVKGDREAGRLFAQHYLAKVEATLRTCTPAVLIDDVKQEVSQRVLLDRTIDPERKHYAGTGDLAAWLCVTAVRRALELQERSRREPFLSEDTLASLPASGDSLELAYLKVRYRSDFKAAFGEALASLSSRERNMLRYHVMDGLNIERVGAVYGVHRATVARWISQARQKLLERTKEQLTHRLHVSPGELESILHLIESDLDVSLPRLLRP